MASNFDFTDKTQQSLSDTIQLAKDYANAQVHPAHLAFVLINEGVADGLSNSSRKLAVLLYLPLSSRGLAVILLPLSVPYRNSLFDFLRKIHHPMISHSVPQLSKRYAKLRIFKRLCTTRTSPRTIYYVPW